MLRTTFHRTNKKNRRPCERNDGFYLSPTITAKMSTAANPHHQAYLPAHQPQYSSESREQTYMWSNYRQIFWLASYLKTPSHPELTSNSKLPPDSGTNISRIRNLIPPAETNTLAAPIVTANAYSGATATDFHRIPILTIRKPNSFRTCRRLLTCQKELTHSFYQSRQPASSKK